ncbi:MAG: hypothetical protein IMW89_15900 [Ktedonobacteraceae bacterium]|nr:hypothetical protein [Ktedonobacteraceae bacterium]
MPATPMRILLFLSSYFPLFVILGILFFTKNLVVALVSFAVGLLSVLALFNYLRWCRRHLQRSFAKVLDYRQRDSEVMTYVATYLIPFVSFPLDLGPQILALIVFLSTLLVLYVNSNLIYVNPMLNLFGYHLYEINLEQSDHSHYYIARGRLKRGETVHYVYISNEVLLAEKN